MGGLPDVSIVDQGSNVNSEFLFHDEVRSLGVVKESFLTFRDNLLILVIIDMSKASRLAHVCSIKLASYLLLFPTVCVFQMFRCLDSLHNHSFIHHMDL